MRPSPFTKLNGTFDFLYATLKGLLLFDFNLSAKRSFRLILIDRISGGLQWAGITEFLISESY